MSNTLSYKLDHLCNNLMFSLIFLAHAFVVGVVTLGTFLFFGSLCVNVWNMPMIFPNLGMSQMLIYSTLVTITLTLLTKGFWLKMIAHIFKPWFNARIQHKNKINHQYQRT